jgi:hypothetical protein
MPTPVESGDREMGAFDFFFKKNKVNLQPQSSRREIMTKVFKVCKEQITTKFLHGKCDQ